MKINGKTISGSNEMVIVIPRASGEDIILRARAVLDMEPFELMCPVPSPPKKMLPGGGEVLNVKDKNYLHSVDLHSQKRLNWMILISLQATEGLEWETVDITDHNTWNNFRTELKDSGFSNVEVNRIVLDCIEVNALNEDKIDEARSRFLLESQELLNESTLQKVEQ